MWISRKKYDEMIVEAGKTPFLAKEVDYWRAKFEQERERADRIGDRVFEIEGRPPVSTNGMIEARMSAAEMSKAAQSRLEEMAGAFEEDDDSDFIVDERITIAPEAAAALRIG